MHNIFYTSPASISKDAIVGISAMADADPCSDKLVAVEGAALDDEGKLIVPSAVKQASLEIAANGLNTAYCSSVGLAGLADLITKETVGADTLAQLENLGVGHSGVICSGGTNAISVALFACVKLGDSIIAQDPHWSGYDSIALALGHRPLECFDFVDTKGNFNLESFKNTVLESFASNPGSSRIAIIMNTPFDNPLAKEVDYNSWKEIISFLDQESLKSGQEVLLILDTAYMDFGPGGKDYSRLSFLKDIFSTLDTRVNVVIASTLSKSFAIYGARVAASILLSKDPELLEQWKDKAGGIIRGMFSSASRPGQELAFNILKDPAKLKNVHEYQSSTVELVQDRQDFLLPLLDRSDCISNISESKNTPLKYIKPDGVFYTSLLITDPSLVEPLYRELIKEHLYLPLISSKYLRLPVCAMRKDFMEKVLERLVNAVKNCHANSNPKK